ncbi:MULTISPECIES: DUF2489 domain-containing protein [Photobacterium]|nr:MULTISPECIES: DUF2489 domain-containing protein [Photobacterium]
MTLWLGLAGTIVAVLATYAGYLLFKLYQQHTRHKAFLERAALQQAEQIKQRNANIMDSVFIIAEAGKQDQCDMSEISIRLYKLMEVLQGEQAVDFSGLYPAMTELYHVVKDMPRGDARKTLQKKERMKLDLERMKAEARLLDDIKQELDAILALKP